MLNGFAALLGFQLAGEIVARAFGLPVPGPVIGMLLLFVVLLRRSAAPSWLEAPANGLLRHLGLLFVPAGVGIVAHSGLLAGAWLPLLLTLLLSTGLTLALTALTLHLLLVRRPAASTQEARYD